MPAVSRTRLSKVAMPLLAVTVSVLPATDKGGANGNSVVLGVGPLTFNSPGGNLTLVQSGLNLDILGAGKKPIENFAFTWPAPAWEVKKLSAPPARQGGKIAADGHLRDGEGFRKFRNRNVIARLEEPQHVLHAFGLREIPKFRRRNAALRRVDGRDHTPSPASSQPALALSKCQPFESRFVMWARMRQTRTR